MGILTGPVSYLRYKTAGRIAKNIQDIALQKLREFSFSEIDPASLKEKAIGWVSVENMASTFFDDLHFLKAPYLVFSLRIDVRRIPALAMKAAYLREELKYKKATGKERLYRKDRDMLREEVRQQLVKKVLPVPSLHDVCWNMSTGVVLFCSTNKNANDEFVNFFNRSFDVKLIPCGPYEQNNASEIPAQPRKKERSSNG